MARNIRAIVPPRTAAALDDIIRLYPVQDGVAEILGYLTLDDGDIDIDIDMGDREMIIDYTTPDGESKRVLLRKVTVTRS